MIENTIAIILRELENDTVINPVDTPRQINHSPSKITDQF